MEKNIPRAAIHVGSDKKTFSAQVSNEAERRGWDEKRYQLKNAEHEKNNHYNFSRKHLNFEIEKGGKIVPLGSNSIPLHERLQQRFDELGFKPYMDADHPDQISKNSPNCTVGIIFSGDHDVLNKLAYGDQKIDTSDSCADHSDVKLQKAIYDWARDTYFFACRKWGVDNVIGFCVHCDETSIHAHVQTIPVEQVKKRGRIGSIYISKDNSDVKLTTKEWKSLSKDERGKYSKCEAIKSMVDRVSYAKVWGEHASDKSAYLSQLHTDYHNEVGYKYGLERGIPYDELTCEEKRSRKHKDKVTLEAERQAKLAVAEAEKQKAEIEAEVSSIQQQKDEAQKDLKSAKSGFIARIFQPDKYKKDEADRMKESYDTGVKDTIDSILKATGLKWKCVPSAEDIGRNYRIIWDSKKNLLKDLNTKDDAISDKNAEIKDLNTKVTTLTEEVDGLKFRISLIDEDAVERLRKSKQSEHNRADKAEKDLSSMRSAYKTLLAQWNALWEEPEFNEARDAVKTRKEREAQEAAERQACELREAKHKEERKNRILDMFISEGQQAQRNFALSHRNYNFSQNELSCVFYAIIAIATRDQISLKEKHGIKTATNSFLEGCDWSNISKFRYDCCCSWTNIFTSRDITFEDSTIDNFLSFVDSMSCSQETYASVGGSNGCADQLTNWDGSHKSGLGVHEKTRKKGV